MDLKQRYSSFDAAMQTLNAYIKGARAGVVGHFFSYPPIPLPVLDINYSICVEKKPLTGLYIHWPYCIFPDNRLKCDFCCSNTKNEPYNKALKDDYYKALLEEIKLYAQYFNNQKLQWIYFGGGTPSIMTDEELNGIFTLLKNEKMIDGNTFITIETRPEFITHSKLKKFKEHHINRISMGVESLNDKVAQKMGRVSCDNNYKLIVKKAVDLLRLYNIEFVNIDIIYGHPYDNIESVTETIIGVLECKPDSIAAYPMGMPSKQTLLEQDVKNGKEIKSLLFREQCSSLINDILINEGYIHVYDCIWSKKNINTYCTIPNCKGIINLWDQTSYMTQGIWVGIGVGSLGYIDGVGPVQNTNKIEDYINMVKNARLPILNGILFSTDELMRAELIQSILHRTIDVSRFYFLFGKSPVDLFPIEFEVLETVKFIQIVDNDIKLTEIAIPFLQAIARFLFSKDIEHTYRCLEKHRVDYEIYKVNYDKYD